MTNESTTTLSTFRANPTQDASDDLDSTPSEVPNGPSIDVSEIDLEELYAIKLRRALTDPRIAHPPSIGYAPNQDHQLYELAAKARFVEAICTHPLYRLEKATWPEVAIYCASASGDARVVDERFVRIYKFALVQILAMEGQDESSLPPMLRQDLQEGPLLSEDSDAGRLAEGLRKHIKNSQDSAFVSNTYEEWDIENVPKRFWTRFGGITAQQPPDPAANGEGRSVDAAGTDSGEPATGNASLDEFL
jgi:hypothetical protein